MAVTKPTIESWIPETVEAFTRVFPAPDAECIVVTKSKEEKIIAEVCNRLEVPTNRGHDNDWAGLTLPGYKGTAIIIRAFGLQGKQAFRYYLWHEMGHAFAFQHESDSRLWANPTPAYMVWAEFIADIIGQRIATANGIPLAVAPYRQLHQIFRTGKINPSTIGHFCSEALVGGYPSDVPKPIIHICEILKAKLQEQDFWKINDMWLERITEQLELLRTGKR